MPDPTHLSPTPTNPGNQPEYSDLPARHEKQIEALLAGDPEGFLAAAGASQGSREGVKRERRKDRSVAFALWEHTGHCNRSLFADLRRGCGCLTQAKDQPNDEIAQNACAILGLNDEPLIPAAVPINWHPDRETLEAFARIQQKNVRLLAEEK